MTKSLESRGDCCRQTGKGFMSQVMLTICIYVLESTQMFSQFSAVNSLLCPRKRAYRCCRHVLPWAGLELSYYFKNSSGNACYPDYSRPSLFQVFRSWGQRKEMWAEKKTTTRGWGRGESEGVVPVYRILVLPPFQKYRRCSSSSRSSQWIKIEIDKSSDFYRYEIGNGENLSREIYERISDIPSIRGDVWNSG